MRIHTLTVWYILLVTLLLICSCKPSRLVKSTYESTAPLSFPVSMKIIKTHMKNGDLYILNRWSYDNVHQTLQGNGSHYDQFRNELAANKNFALPIEEIALFEGNILDNSGQTVQTVAMSATSVLSFIANIICASDPKACFGSCPTYYAYNGREMSLQGEGFSSSMYQVFEQKELDMMYDVHNLSDTFMLEIRNEALETHMIRYCDLLVIPRYETERVYASMEGTFYTSSRIVEPDSCEALEGDIRPKVRYYDEVERFSMADSIDLSKKESITLTFPNDHKKYGLIITSRQSLMTTFLFYQTMAYFGTKLAHWVTRVDRGHQMLVNKCQKINEQLGGIEVFMELNHKKWIKIDEIKEMGPIASDFHLIELPEVNGDKINIRLQMTQGLWRIDYVALAELENKVEPIRIQPFQLTKSGRSIPEILGILNDPSQYFVTFPGDRYHAYYNLPEDERLYEYYILSEGYYQEWMREEWFAEENRNMMSMIFLKPKKYLEVMAPEFKKAEPFMEEIFWNSKLQTH